MTISPHYHGNIYSPSVAWINEIFDPLFLKLDLGPPFLEWVSDREYSRINSSGIKAEQFLQMMGFTKSKKGKFNEVCRLL